MYGIDEQILNQDYYIRCLSMFMRDSLGLAERTNYVSSLIIQLANVQQEIYERLNIVKDYDGIKSYYSDWLENKDKDPFGYEDFFLDTIGEIINCPRKFTVNYGVIYKLNNSDKVTIGGIEYTFYKSGDVYNRFSEIVDDDPVYYEIFNGRFKINSTNYGINSYDGTIALIPQTTVGHSYTNKKYVILNNYEYLFYLLVQITKSHYFGTREELNVLYNPQKLNFVYAPTTNPCEISIFWDTSSAFGDKVTPSVDLLYAFLDGKLTIESMGITYTKSIGNPHKLALFDVARWDKAYWQYYEPVNVQSGIFDQSDWDVAIWG